MDNFFSSFVFELVLESVGIIIFKVPIMVLLDLQFYNTSY